MTRWLPLLLLVAVAALARAQDADAGAAGVRARLQGAWSEVDGTRLLRFDGGLSIMAIDGGQSVFDVAYDGDTLTRTPRGLGPTLVETVAFDGETLVLGYPEGHALRWARLDEIPEALRIEPFALGAREPDPAEVIDIQLALADRVRAEQEPRVRLQALTDEAQRTDTLDDPVARQSFYAREDVQDAIADMARIDASNEAWLLDRLHDVGWIDPVRFGPEANGHAFLLVQHSMHLGLMRTVLPRLEQEARADARRGQHFALLHDRTMLQLGGTQRYGTQILPLEDGRYHVLALEDPAGVDARRAALGMGPLDEYLALWRAAGAEVVVDDAGAAR